MIEKKRIRIFLIIILAIPILCLIGFGTWIITNKLILKPNIEVDKVLTEYLNSQEGTYNGNVLLPNSEVLGIVNDGRNSELKYYYKEKDSSTNYIECVDSDKSIGPINAGEYLIKVEYQISNNLDPVTITDIVFKINPLDITDNNDISICFTEHEDNTFIYTGSEIKPTDVQVKYKDNELKINNDYTIDYLNNINVSTDAVVKVSGIGNFKGTKELKFTISDKPKLIYLKATNGTTQTVVYDGTEQTPEVKAYSNEECTEELTGVTLSYPIKYKNAGEHLIRIIATKENFETATIEISLTIEPKELELEWHKSDYTYNGTAQGPACTGSNLIDGDNCNISTTRETNAGSYTSTIQSISNENYKLPTSNLECNYTIKKTDYKLSASGKVSFDGEYYIEGNPLTISGYKLIDVNNKVVDCNQEAEIDNIRFNDGTNSSHSVSVTIRCYVSGNTKNYNDFYATTSVTIYAVATINDKYYGTVERALSNAVSGNEVYLIPKMNPTLRANAEVKSNVTLLLVYENNNFRDNTKGSNGAFADTNEKTYLKNTLTINDGITLTNNGTIKIDGITGHAGVGLAAQTSGNYTQIMMNPSSKIESNGSIYCLGFIKESSLNNDSIINVNKGDITAPLVFYDFKGGSASLYLKKNNVFPMKIFDLPNVKPKLRIYSSAQYSVITDIYMNNEHFNQKGLYIIGNSSNSSSLIYLSSGYVDMKYNSNSTPSLTSGEHIIDIHGNCTTGSLSVNFKYLTIIYNISTADFYCPLSWKFKINIYNSMTITSKFEFLPGSSVTVHKNATLQIDKDCVFYEAYKDQGGTAALTFDDNKESELKLLLNTPALLTVNGICKVNSNISGRIATTTSGAQLYIYSSQITKFSDGNATASSMGTSGTMYYAKCNETELKNVTLLTKGCFENSTDYSTTFNSKSYYLSKGTYWESQVPDGTYTITYHYKDINGNDTTQTIEYNIFTGIDPTIQLISVPDVNYHTLTGWFSDESYTYSYDTINIEKNGNYSIYAKYSLTEYSVNYIIDYDDCEPSLDDLTDGFINQFTYNDINPNGLSFDTPTYEPYYFDGWYLDMDYSIKLPNNKLSYENWLNYGSLVENGIVLYGKFSNKQKYTISFVTNYDKMATPESQYVFNSNEIELPSTSSIDNDSSLSSYFEGWYTDSSLDAIYKFNENIVLDSDITLYAKWNNKLVIKFNDNDDNTIQTSYLLPGNNLSSIMPNAINKADTKSSDNKYYIVWNYIGISKEKNSSITINPENEIPTSNMIYYAAYEDSGIHYVNINISKVTDATYTITYTDINGSSASLTDNGGRTIKVKYNTSVTFVMKYNNAAEKSFFGDVSEMNYISINGTKYGSDQTGGFTHTANKSQNYQFTPSTADVTVIIESTT